MKQYFKPIVLSGMGGVEPDDPIQPGVGSQVGGDSSGPATSTLNMFTSQSVLDAAQPTNQVASIVEAPSAEASDLIDPAAADPAPLG